MKPARRSLALCLLAATAASSQTGVQTGTAASGAAASAQVPQADTATGALAQTPALPQIPQVTPITGFVPTPPNQSPEIQHAAASNAITDRSRAHGLGFSFFGLLGPYRRPSLPELFPGSGDRLRSLIRDNKLYLSLHDAISLAIENNLDVEVERYNLQLADDDLLRAKGGGSLRGIDYTVQATPNGVGGPGSPLLNTAATNPNPTVPTVTDLTSLNSTIQTTLNFGENGTALLPSNSTSVPLFDPSFILTGGYLRRSDTVSLTSTTGTTTTGTGTGSPSGTVTEAAPIHFIAANVAYLQGFSPGTQLEATVNNDSQVIYGSASENDPFYAPSTSVTLTQPLLRGRGRAVNLRYVRIANLDRRVSRLLFDQQVQQVVYGISRLYFDLVSLGENVAVQQEALRAAQKLRKDDAEQVIEGTLAPIELTRASALVSSSEFALVQAQGLYRQQEVILRNQLIRTGSPVFGAAFSEIVPTDRIIVPEIMDTTPVPDLIEQGLARRPDLAQARVQVQAGQTNLQGSRNQVLPQLNLYANAQTRGTSEQAYEPLGSLGTGIPTTPTNLALGGLRTSTIYQAGIQLTLPLRNRVAASDAARDTIVLRQTQARTEKLSNEVRVEIENAVIALETSHAAYNAARNSTGYQEQFLQTEIDKLSVGESTNLQVIQDETYLAQARSTEIAARSNWKKAQIDLEKAIGALLEDNRISLDDAVHGTLPR
jgi:outer membrane protein